MNGHHLVAGEGECVGGGGKEGEGRREGGEERGMGIEGGGEGGGGVQRCVRFPYPHQILLTFRLWQVLFRTNSTPLWKNLFRMLSDLA